MSAARTHTCSCSGSLLLLRSHRRDSKAMSSPVCTSAVAVNDGEMNRLLAELVVALRDAEEMNRQVLQRIADVRTLRAEGMAWREIANSGSPLAVELLARSLHRQSEAGGRFRKAAARVLYAEGLAMEEIAELFGVSRQRVSLLINQRPG